MIMPKETIKARNARVGQLLAEYDAETAAQRKAETRVKELKALVDEIDSGTYGDWILSRGTPREILDQPAAKDIITKAGQVVPTKMTRPPLVVTSVHTA
jgi:hypothetical protein